ncbi:hypothetical protein Bca52824_014433 [Brassica carinata]|uniref:Uncharacterized protein n=1 Tax=Brassica carinata TaxID=52824 RepID=A0A8X8B3F5_BRACI|nr:hypothetical protein Bca52824_014433 [Brassica carinata]
MRNPLNGVADRGTPIQTKSLKSKSGNNVSTLIYLNKSRERRERGEVAREAVYLPAMDDRRSHCLSNHKSLDENPEPYPTTNQISGLIFGANNPQNLPNNGERGAGPLRHRRRPRANHR